MFRFTDVLTSFRRHRETWTVAVDAVQQSHPSIVRHRVGGNAKIGLSPAQIDDEYAHHMIER